MVNIKQRTNKMSYGTMAHIGVFMFKMVGLKAYIVS